MSNSALNQYSQQLQVLQGGAFSEVLNPSTSATSSTDSSSISALLLSLISALAVRSFCGLHVCTDLCFVK